MNQPMPTIPINLEFEDISALANWHAEITKNLRKEANRHEQREQYLRSLIVPTTLTSNIGGRA